MQIEHAYDEKAAVANSINDGAAMLTSDVRVGEGKEVSGAWASDAPSHVAPGGGDEGAMSDPWAVPASSVDGGGWSWDDSDSGGGDFFCGGDSGGDCGGGCGGD